MKVWTSEGVLIKSSFTFTWLAFPNELIDFQRYHLLDAEATRLVAKPESFHGLAQSLDETASSLPNDAARVEPEVSFSSYILQPHLFGLHRKGAVYPMLGRLVPEREVRVSQYASSRFRVL